MSREEFIKIFKNKNNLLIAVILIIGIALMAVSGGHDGKGKETVKAENVSAQSDEEKRLEDILAQIDGVGKVSVMITYYSSAEKDIAYETKTASREDKSEMSEDKKAVMTDGNPMVVKEVYPKVKGVVVAAEGAGDVSVRKAVSEAVTASLDVPAHKICIFKKEEE